MLLTGVSAWPGTAHRGASRDPGPRHPPRSHNCSDTGCCRPKYSELLGLKTIVMWSAPGTKWPSVTTSALFSCPAGAWVLGAVLFLCHPRDWGLRLDQGSYVLPPASQRQSLMASFLVPSHLGAPGPGDPSFTPTLSTQDHFWEPASLQPPSIDLWGQSEKGEQHGLYKMGGGPGASLVMIHRCAPFKPRFHPLGDSIPSSSLFLGQPGRKKA